MNSLKVFGVIAMTVGVLLQPARSSAHHSFAAEFDGTKCRDVAVREPDRAGSVQVVRE